MTAQTTASTHQAQPAVTSIDAHGVTVRLEGAPRLISWGSLAAAAGQDDAELASAYRRILDEAQARASLESPVEVAVEQDSTNVWWVVRVRAVWGGGHVQMWPGKGWRAADQGGTHPKQHLARHEAEDVVGKLRARGRDVRLTVP